MFNETITIFNRVGSRVAGDKWYAHVLKNVCVYRSHAGMVATMGENSTDNASVIIRLGHGCTTNGLTYLKPKEWIKNNKYSTTFTVKSGNEFDFIYCGSWNDAEIDDNSYQDGFYNYMLKNYDDVFIVTSVGDFSTSFLPHLEVSCQ